MPEPTDLQTIQDAVVALREEVREKGDGIRDIDLVVVVGLPANEGPPFERLSAG